MDLLSVCPGVSGSGWTLDPTREDGQVTEMIFHVYTVFFV